MPVDAAKPAIGDVGKLEQVDEHRIETVVNDTSGDHQIMKDIISELKRVRIQFILEYDIISRRYMLGSPVRRGRLRCV